MVVHASLGKKRFLLLAWAFQPVGYAFLEWADEQAGDGGRTRGQRFSPRGEMKFPGRSTNGHREGDQD
jgi:hypothetical protein